MPLIITVTTTMKFSLRYMHVTHMKMIVWGRRVKIHCQISSSIFYSSTFGGKFKIRTSVSSIKLVHVVVVVLHVDGGVLVHVWEGRGHLLLRPDLIAPLTARNSGCDAHKWRHLLSSFE